MSCLMSDLVIASLEKYRHTWHQMSLLRPGVIKQHKHKHKPVSLLPVNLTQKKGKLKCNKALFTAMLLQIMMGTVWKKCIDMQISPLPYYDHIIQLGFGFCGSPGSDALCSGRSSLSTLCFVSQEQLLSFSSHFSQYKASSVHLFLSIFVVSCICALCCPWG